MKNTDAQRILNAFWLRSDNNRYLCGLRWLNVIDWSVAANASLHDR